MHEQEEVSEKAVVMAHVVAQECLGCEPSAPNIATAPSWSATTLTVSSVRPSPTPLPAGSACLPEEVAGRSVIDRRSMAAGLGNPHGPLRPRCPQWRSIPARRGRGGARTRRGPAPRTNRRAAALFPCARQQPQLSSVWSLPGAWRPSSARLRLAEITPPGRSRSLDAAPADRGRIQA